MNILDPSDYGEVRRPLEQAQTLPPGCYTSEVFFRREVERIFLKCWNLVGRTDYVPAGGDFFTLDLVGIPVIVMRGRDGQIRAFINACRHRGAKLLEGSGNCPSIRCPYHSWTYDTDGRLRSAVGMQEAVGFDVRAHSLRAVRLEVWLGFIFICFDDASPPLMDYLGDLSDSVESYRFEDMVTVARKDFAVRSNWKCYVENSMENLHLPTVHEKSIGNVQAIWTPIVGKPGNYAILHSKAERSRATLSGEPGFARIPSLSGRAAEGAQYILIYPATVLGCDLDCMWFKQMIPDGPDRMRNLAAFCFPRSAVERPDFEQVVAAYHRRFDVVIGEDNRIAERQFQGLNQPFATPGRFSPEEALVHAIDNWILDRVLDVSAHTFAEQGAPADQRQRDPRHV